MRFFKPVLRLLLLFTVLVLSTSFIYELKEDKPMYYVAAGWEFYYTRPTSGATGQPVVSNVVFVNCKWHANILVTNQFSKYYDAYYKKSRGTTGLERMIGFSYETYSQAENKRRELIADYNYKWTPLLLSGFSVLCED
jgi:hypothetical protein